MNRGFVIFCVIVFGVFIIQPVGCNFVIQSYDLGHDSNGYEVRAQCQNQGDGSFIVVIDDGSIGSPDQAVIICHEVGHVQHWDDWDEADCDDFANSVGVGYIQDAYHGIH